MTTLLLVRHGLTAMTGPVLAGWTPGVHLDDRGKAQAATLAERLLPIPVRAIDAVRDHNARLGDEATWVAVSHGDVIKAIVADALGMHLDMFQRIQVDPCSLTVIRYTTLRPFVVRLNDVGGPVADLLPPKRRSRRRAASSDAAVGGGAGESL